MSEMEHARIVGRAGPAGFCYMSGLTLYDEALLNGRWVGRYWAANGFPASEKDLAWIEPNTIKPARTLGLDLHAFGLAVDGQSLHWGWQAEGQGVEPAGSQGQQAWVALRSTLRPIVVRVHTRVDGSGFLVRWLEITNRGQAPAALGEVHPFSGVLNLLSAGLSTQYYSPLLREPAHQGPSGYTLGYLAESDWSGEGSFEWLPVPRTPLRIEGRQGKSGHGHPFFILRNDKTGESWVGGLAWSGNWMCEFSYAEKKLDKDLSCLGFRCGPAGPAPLRVLAPGETVTTPAVHLGLLYADLDGCVQAWHRHLRGDTLPRPAPDRELLVNYDHWGYMEHELSEERLCQEVDLAAEVGAEVFTVDAGWYGDRDTNWWATVGNWRAGNRLPRGLEPVYARAREKGLLCGLWFDAERIGAESLVAREHPEWFIPYYGGPSDEFDLTNPQAQRWLEEQLTRVIERYSLDLFRLDYNTSPFEGGQTQRDGYWENTRWRHYEFTYALYERLQRRFPRLILENCAGGGGRTDLGMMGRFHYVQATDWPILPRSVRILNGLSMALPPECLLFWTGTGQCANVRGDLDTQMRLAVLTHFGLTGLAPSPGERNEALIARVKHHIALYKSFMRPLLADCRIYHPTPVLGYPEPGGWCALEYASADGTRAALAAFRLAGEAPSGYRLTPRGLLPGRTYRVTSDNSGHTFEAPGWTLADEGVTVNVGHALGSELLLLEAQGDAATPRARRSRP